jgi:hypothetical protein
MPSPIFGLVANAKALPFQGVIMTTFKDVLCLLAIFVAYGIVGRLDYEDAVRLEQTRRERLHADCLTATPADCEALARINDQPFDPSTRRTDAGAPDDGPCTPHVL